MSASHYPLQLAVRIRDWASGRVGQFILLYLSKLSLEYQSELTENWDNPVSRPGCLVTQMEELDRYLDEHSEQFESELIELLRIPSISADKAFGEEVRHAAQWICQQFSELGFRTELIETEGNPLVYAESLPVPGKPTALVYGHYDVQPPDPLREWLSPPFEPTRRGSNIHARGATDDKGQMFTHIKSAEAWIRTEGRLPIQLKYLIEGEEEVGSRALTSYVDSARNDLNCDVIVISDTSQFARDHPAITYGLRGIAYFELRMFGPTQDLHSGTFGGAVTNPANALTRLLATLIDDRGRIQIPYFYADVLPISDRERSQLSSLPFNEEAFRAQVGVDALGGEQGYSILERRWARPAFDINGLTSGYQGEGSKTVLPSEASAKFSFRLVPEQNPGLIAENLRTFLEAQCPPGIRMELVDMHGAPGFVASLDSPFVDAAARAIANGFGRPPVFIREGGSIPIVTSFRAALAADVLLLGWGLDDDNTHSPNEKFSLIDFHRGIKSSAYLWNELAQISI